MLGLRHRDREPIAAVDVQHHVDVGAAVADVHDPIVRDLELLLELVQHRHLAVAGRHLDDGLDLSGGRIVAEPGAEHVVGRDDAVERRLHDLLRCRGDHVEEEPVPVDPVEEQLGEQPDVVLETNPLAHLDEMLPAHAAVFGIVQQQVRELSALLHQVDAGEPGDLLVEGRGAEQLAQDGAGVLEAQRLVKVTGQEILPHVTRSVCHTVLPGARCHAHVVRSEQAACHRG